MKGTLYGVKGIYIGDICYALEEDVYFGVWGKNNYQDGEYETEDGKKFAVAHTKHGDGTFRAKGR